MSAIKYYIVSKRKLLLIFTLTALAFIALAVFYSGLHTAPAASLVMGARFINYNSTQSTEHLGQVKEDPDRYFRPSKLPVLNNRVINHDMQFKYQDIAPADINLHESYYKSAEDALLNYFSIIKDGENLTKDKISGCGTVGSAKLPFPLGYSFFTPEYKQRVDYNQYLKSFEGIGHTNLIKLKALPPDKVHPDKARYFVEIETLEGSDKGVTYFAYYFGFAYIEKQAEKHLIADLQLYGEDFLCAPYHGWYHDAEANVSTRYGYWCDMIEKQYPVKQNGYTKKIWFEGKDGSNYIIEFMNLTNGTDVEVAQYKQSKEGPWEVIYLNPEECVKDK